MEQETAWHRFFSHPIFLIFFVLFCIMAVGGITLAYSSGSIGVIESYIPFLSHAPYDKTTILTDLAKGLDKIHTSEWDIKFHIFTAKRDAGATPYPSDSSSQSAYGGSAGMVGIPSSFDALLDLNGATDSAKENARVAVSLNVSAEDLTIAFAAELRRVGDTIYTVITKIPSIFGNFAAIKDKWVSLTPAELLQYGSLFGLPSSQVSSSGYEATPQDVADMKTLFTIALDDHVLVSADPKKIRNDGSVHYAYDLTLDPDAVPKFLNDASRAFRGGAPSTLRTIFTDDGQNPLITNEGKAYIAYIAKNVTFSITVDTAGVPSEFKISVRVVPSDGETQFKDKQIMFEGSVAMDNINKDIAISAPPTSISLDEAYKLITGANLVDSLKKARDAKRVSDLASVRLALELYRNDNGSYPETTAFLAPTYIASLPLDPLDRTTYTYQISANGSSYSLGTDLEVIGDAPDQGSVSTFNCAVKKTGRFCYRVSPSSSGRSMNF
jgi:type II secretory pathway pseudopilin PulG